MAGELERLTAAQAKADEVIRAIAEPIDSDLLLQIAVSDAETGQRLATGFVNYSADGAPVLRLVTS